MKKSKRILVVVTLMLIVISSILTGCKETKNSEQADVAPNQDAKVDEKVNESSEETVKEDVDIRVAYFGSPAINEILLQMINDFQSDYEYITVEAIHSNWKGHHDKIKAELAAGDGPTVFLMDGVFVEGYAQRDTLEELTGRIENELDGDKYYGIEALRNPDGKLFAIPQGIQVDVLYYNKEMFDAAGVSYPNQDWTLENLKEAAVQLTDAEKGQFGFAINNAIRFGYYPIIRSFGGDLLDDSRKNSTIAEDPKVREAILWIKNAWEEKWVPNYDDMAGELSKKAATYFPRKKVAMSYDNFSGVAKAQEAGVDFDVVAQPMAPNGEKYAAYIANTWIMNSHSSEEQKDAGWEFMKYFLSDEGQQTFSKAGSTLAVNKSICQDRIEKATEPENIEVFLDVLEYASPLGENAVWKEWVAAFEQAFELYLVDRLTIDEFIEKADTDVQKVLDAFYKK